MPQAETPSCGNGPMGPGFFMLFPAHADIFYDGGPMDALIGDDGKKKRKKKRKEHETDILIALSLMMLEQ